MVAVAAIRQRRILWPEGAPATPIDGVLRQSLVGASWTQCRRLVETGKVSANGVVFRDPRAIVVSNTEILIEPRAPRPRDIEARAVRLVYHDAQIVVVDKPTGVSTVPYDANERGTLDELARAALSKLHGHRLAPLGIAHRIDKATSGLV